MRDMNVDSRVWGVECRFQGFGVSNVFGSTHAEVHVTTWVHRVCIVLRDSSEVQSA